MGDGDFKNKGSLWPSKGFRGSVDIGGNKFYVLMIATQTQNDKAPVYKAIIEQGREAQVVPIWRDDKPENKRKGYFEYADHYISIFNNEPGANPNSPVIGLSAMPKETPAQNTQPPQQDGSEPPQTEEEYGC